MALAPATSGWAAQLQLGFARRGDATALVRRRHHGPLAVQRPFFPEGPGVCHVYVLHPPGGVVGGDSLDVDVDVGAGAHALLTTPAAGKAYRAMRTGATAHVRQTLHVGAHGALEWLPQELILHDGAEGSLRTIVSLDVDARFIGLDGLCFGLPARAEPWTRGRCRQRLEVWRAGEPLVIERGCFDAGPDLDVDVHRATWGLRGLPVLATLIASPAPEASVIDALRARGAGAGGDDIAGVSVVADGAAVVCRYAGASAERARRFAQDAWSLLRPAVTGLAPRAPRIWST